MTMSIEPNRINSIQTSDSELDRIRSNYSARTRAPLSTILGKIGFWLLVVVIIVYTLFPFYWAIVSSLTPTNDLYATPVKFWPQNVTLEHYRTVFNNSNFVRALLNSTIVSFSVVILALLLGTLGAYALGRLHFRGRTIILYLILSMTMFPAIAILGSLFQMMQDFKA